MPGHIFCGRGQVQTARNMSRPQTRTCLRGAAREPLDGAGVDDQRGLGARIVNQGPTVRNQMRSERRVRTGLPRLSLPASPCSERNIPEQGRAVLPYIYCIRVLMAASSTWYRLSIWPRTIMSPRLMFSSNMVAPVVRYHMRRSTLFSRSRARRAAGRSIIRSFIAARWVSSPIGSFRSRPQGKNTKA